MTYDETTGLYTATIGNSVTDSDYDNTLYFSISTAVSSSSSTTEFEEASLITGSVLVNGQYATLTTGSAGTYTIKLPYGATEWKITVDLTNNRICAYTSDADPNAPSVGTVDASTTWTTVYFYDVTDDTSYEMTTTDGNSYYLNKAIGSSSSTYHNFRFYTGNWESQYSTGDAVSVGTEYSLLSYVSSDTQFPSSTTTGWSSWLDGTYLTTSNYIWFNLETLSFKITTSSSSPWTLKEVTSVTYSQYTCSFDNTNTGWDEVYVYALDSDGNEICGVWPGMRLTDPTSGDIWTWSIITSGNAPATVSFSNGYSTDSKTETWAFEEAKVYAGEATETGGDDGGDSGSEGGSTGGLTYDHYYFAGGTHTTYLDNPDEFLYHPTTGLYTATLDCSSSTWVVIFTELASTQTTTWTDVASSSIVPTGSVENGVAQAYTAYTTDMSANSFAVPYAGTWDIILDPTNGTITCYSTDTEPVASVIMQDITNSSSIVANEMTTTDGGTTYCYSGKASSSWMTFNFPINDYAVTYSTGQGVSLNTYYQCYPKGTWTSDYDYPYDDTIASTPTSNTTLTYYDSWNGTSWSTSTTYYFWFNYETKQCYVTTSSSTPTGWATTSTTDYTVTYDNSETGWSTVFAQFYDASGNLVIGALPGVHMTEGTDGKWTVTVALTSAPSTVTFTDGSYVYSSSTAGDTSTFTNNGSYKYTVETEADVAWPELYLYGYAEDYGDEKSPTASQKMVNNGDGTYTFTVTEAMANAYDSGVQFGKITTHDWTAQYGPEILSMDGTAYTDSDNKYNVWLGHKFVLTTGDQDSTIGNLYLTEQPTAESVITFDITSAEAPTLLIGEYSDVDSDSYYLAGYGYLVGTWGNDDYSEDNINYKNFTDEWKFTYDEETGLYTLNFNEDMITTYNNYLAYKEAGTGEDHGFSFGVITNSEWTNKYGATTTNSDYPYNIWPGETFTLTHPSGTELTLTEAPDANWVVTFDAENGTVLITAPEDNSLYLCGYNGVWGTYEEANRFTYDEESGLYILKFTQDMVDAWPATSNYIELGKIANKGWSSSWGSYANYTNDSNTEVTDNTNVWVGKTFTLASGSDIYGSLFISGEQPTTNWELRFDATNGTLRIVDTTLYLLGYDGDWTVSDDKILTDNGDGTYSYQFTQAMVNAWIDNTESLTFGNIATRDYYEKYGATANYTEDGEEVTDNWNVWLYQQFTLTKGSESDNIPLSLTQQPTTDWVITFNPSTGSFRIDDGALYLVGYNGDWTNSTVGDAWKMTRKSDGTYQYRFTADMVNAWSSDNGGCYLGHITNGDWSVKYGAPVIGGSHEHNVWHGEDFQLTVGDNSTEDMSLWLSERPSTDWLITFDPSTSILNISGTAQHDYYICSVPTVDFNAITEATGDVNYGKEMRFCIKKSSSYTIEQMHSTDGDVYWISGTTGSTSGYFTTTDVSNAKSYGIFFRYANSSGTYDYYNPDSTIDALDTVYTTTAKENQSSTSSGYTYQKVTTTSFSTNDYVWFRKSTGEFAITTTDVCPFIEYYPMTQDCEAHYATGITTTEGQSFYITDKYDNNYANGDAIPVETLTDMTWGLTESTTESAVTSDYYWWFNESTKEFIITTSSENPWALPEVTSVHFLNSVEGTTVNDSRKMNYIEEDGSPRYYIELTGRMDHWNSCYFVLNAGESNETRVGNAGLTNGVKTKQNVMTSATKAGWNTSDADGWNTVWYDPTTGEAWMTGAKILYLACEANNWLVDSSSDSGSVRKMAEEEDDDTTDSMDSYRLTYTDESCVDRYFINGVTMDADTPYAIADREWSVRYSTGDEVEANNESNAVSENTDDSALYNMWAPSDGYSNVNMDLVLDPDTPVFTVYTSENQQTGIEGLQGAEADADVMYFNLQGMRIRKPQHGTFYIRVEGKTAEKILY